MTRTSDASPAEWRGILARSSLIVGLAIALSTLGLVIAAYDPLPFWDQWDNLVSNSEVTWSWLSQLHNEHRIAFGRLIFAADYWLSHESYRLAFLGIVAFPLTSLALVVRLARRPGGAVPDLWAIGVALGLLFSAMQNDNFTWAFQVQFFALCTLVVATLSVLALGPATPVALVAVVVLEAVALYTLSSGAVLLVVTIVVAVAVRRPWWHVAVLAGSGALLLGTYLHDYATPATHANPLDALSHLGQFGLFCLVLLGHPAGVLIGGTAGAGIFGIVGLAWLAACARRLWRAGRSVAPEEVVLLAVAAFVTGMVVLIGLGRWRFGIGQAMVPRYATPVLMFWLALLLLEGSGRSLADGPGQARIPAIGLAILFGLLINQPRFIASALRERNARTSAAVAVLAGVGDSDLLKRTYPVAADVLTYRDAMKAQHTSVFGADWADWLDQPFRIPAAWPVPPCPGSFEQLTAVLEADHPGWRAGGHLTATLPKLSTRMIFVDADQTVRGYGLSGVSDRIAFLGPDQRGTTSWLGEVEDVDPSTIRAYPLRTDGLPACSLGPVLHVVGRPAPPLRPER